MSYEPPTPPANLPTEIVTMLNESTLEHLQNVATYAEELAEHNTLGESLNTQDQHALNDLGIVHADGSLNDMSPTVRMYVDLDEIGYALSSIEAERVLSDHTPTDGKVAYKLIQATEPVSQVELADRTGATGSIRNNRDALEALGIVSIERGAWWLNLSFRTTEERRNQMVPEFTTGAFIDAVDALLTVVLSPVRYGDPDDPVGGTLFWPPRFGK